MKRKTFRWSWTLILLLCVCLVRVNKSQFDFAGVAIATAKTDKWIRESEFYHFITWFANIPLALGIGTCERTARKTKSKRIFFAPKPRHGLVAVWLAQIKSLKHQIPSTVTAKSVRKNNTEIESRAQKRKKHLQTHRNRCRRKDKANETRIKYNWAKKEERGTHTTEKSNAIIPVPCTIIDALIYRGCRFDGKR